MIELALLYLAGIGYFWYTAYRYRITDDKDCRKAGARMFFLAPLWPMLLVFIVTLPYFLILGLAEAFKKIFELWKDAQWKSLWTFWTKITL